MITDRRWPSPPHTNWLRWGGAETSCELHASPMGVQRCGELTRCRQLYRCLCCHHRVQLCRFSKRASAQPHPTSCTHSQTAAVAPACGNLREAHPHLMPQSVCLIDGTRGGLVVQESVETQVLWRVCVRVEGFATGNHLCSFFSLTSAPFLDKHLLTGAAAHELFPCEPVSGSKMPEPTLQPQSPHPPYPPTANRTQHSTTTTGVQACDSGQTPLCTVSWLNALRVATHSLTHTADHSVFAALCRSCLRSLQRGAAQRGLRHLHRDLPQPLALVHILCRPAAAPLQGPQQLPRDRHQVSRPSVSLSAGLVSMCGCEINASCQRHLKLRCRTGVPGHVVLSGCKERSAHAPHLWLFPVACSPGRHPTSMTRAWCLRT